MSESSPAGPVRFVSLSCTALLLLTLAPALHGAPAPKAAKAPRPPQTFDPAVEQLPPSFAGSDFTDLFKAKSAAPKGEFETSDNYRARMKAVSGDSFYALPLDLSAKYDADQQRFKATIRADKPEAAVLIHSREARAIVVGETRRELGKYIGSNAFGVRAKVTMVHMTEDAVVINHALGGLVGFREMLVPVPSDRANATKLSFLLVFKPEPIEGAGLTTTASGYSTATLDHPYERQTTYRYIFAGETVVWAYNKKTGQVLGKFKLATARLPTPTYPGATNNALGDLLTTDSLDKVLAFYQDQLENLGLTVTVSRPAYTSDLATLTADSSDKKRRVTVMIMSGKSQTSITYEEKYEEEP